MEPLGCSNFRYKIAFSILTGNNIQIRLSRPLQIQHQSYLDLLLHITEGSSYSFSQQKTLLHFSPGSIVNGQLSPFNTSRGHSLGYFLEPLLLISPFGKNPLEITLNGDAFGEGISVDSIINGYLKQFANFGENSVLTISERKAGTVSVSLKINVVRNFQAINLTDPGLVRRVRGVAFTIDTVTSIANRLVYSAKGVFNEYIPNVWIFTDCRGDFVQNGQSGYGISLVAETTTGCFLTNDSVSKGTEDPEKLTEECANNLLKEISQGGCISSDMQKLFISAMSLTDRISKVKIGNLSEETIVLLRDIKSFFGLVFKVTPLEDNTVELSCKGSDYSNSEKRHF